MKKNSLVKYIGGQDKVGKKIFKLDPNQIYTVKSVCKGKFADGKKDAIILEECGDFGFLKSMFVEVQPPMKVTLESLFKDTKYNILSNMN
jgi:hypothetical protein